MRINVGSQASVTASEKWLSYIQAGQAFAFAASLGPTAGVISHVQLFNPVGSGKTVLVRRAFSSLVTSTDTINLNLYNTALATDVGAGLNLLSGAAAGQAHVRSGTNATQLGTNFAQLYTAIAQPQPFGPDWLCQLAAGQGVLVCGSAVNTWAVASFYWVEF
jgi:hypothetical protein